MDENTAVSMSAPLTERLDGGVKASSTPLLVAGVVLVLGAVASGSRRKSKSAQGSVLGTVLKSVLSAAVSTMPKVVPMRLAKKRWDARAALLRHAPIAASPIIAVTSDCSPAWFGRAEQA
jgi:hypothetical protein